MATKPGYKTSEFWITAIANIAGAIVALMAARGLLSAEEGDLWLALVMSVAVAAVPIALAYMNGQYISSRAEIKAQEIGYQVNIERLTGGVGDIGTDSGQAGGG